MGWFRAALTAALGFVAAACASPGPPGVYSGSDPFRNGGARYVRISLLQDGAASVQLSSPERAGDFFSEGRWQRRADGRVEIDLAGEPLVFRISGDQLVAASWDRKLFGDVGPGVLYRVR